MKKLDINEKQNVQYAIPLWLRDEQVKQAVARVKERIQPVDAPRTEPVAIAGFGPSLSDTWEKLRDFHWVISCSGSHKFLIERGIIPNWHVEVDPRPHKVQLLGQPHVEVEYLVASTCNPKYFDHLNGYKVRLWHVFDASEDGLRLLPRGEWAITGGCDVGLRCLTIASFLGFRELHVFGLDGCAKTQDGERHAAYHPNGKQPYAYVEYKGQTYWTTPAMLEAARQTFHELDQLPKVRATFYGDGLIQAMAKDYVPKQGVPLENVVGFSKPELISVEYRELNERLHRDNLAYGVGGGKHAEIVLQMAKSISSQSILDYGCGKGYLAKALPFPIWEYDPAVPGKQESPRPADLVVCTDVLEHIEPEKLKYVLDDIRRCMNKIGFFTIHTGPAQKQLADGRNTHLLQHPESWWRQKLEKFFVVQRIFKRGPELYVVVTPKVGEKKMGKLQAMAV